MIFYFILALFILVTVHEFGHFIVARWCGVKVLRFSFGFGKVLASWRDRRGTEYAWSLIPLGGYVKMLDEEEGEVSPSEKHLAFNQQSVWAKMAIAFAGPLFNFLFAFFAFWLVLVLGIQSLAPMVDRVIPGSIASQSGFKAGEEIVAFNGSPIKSWRAFQYKLISRIGTQDKVQVDVKSMTTGENATRTLDLAGWSFDGKNKDMLLTLGIKPFVPTIPPLVGEVLPDSPASATGLKTGDVILKADGKPIDDWFDLLEWVKNNPAKLSTIVVRRQGVETSLPVKLGMAQKNGHMIGSLGVRSQQTNWPQGWLRIERSSPIAALKGAFQQTVDLTMTSFVFIGRLATGKLSLHGISGPVGIAQGAGDSAKVGFAYYLSFLALISISLGVLNLLPIPILDGGHLFYYLIELIVRRPLSVQFKSIGMYIGFTFLMALMILALTNDIGRIMDRF
jgi:regulator of sigma E protease